MSIVLMKGDLFESKCEILTITVNCVGIMGKGIALTAAQKYPRLKKEYKQLCNVKRIEPGSPIIVNAHDKKFLLFPTKDHWRNNSKIEWIEKGLSLIRKNCPFVRSLALPPLGCGNGNLDFDEVYDLMMKYLCDVDCDIHIYPPKGWVENHV